MHGQQNIKSVKDVAVKQRTDPPTLLRVNMQI